MREHYAAMFARFPKNQEIENRCTVLNHIAVGRHVVDQELIEGRDGKPFRTVARSPSTGGRGLIAEVRFLSKEFQCSVADAQ